MNSPTAVQAEQEVPNTGQAEKTKNDPWSLEHILNVEE